MNPKCRTALGKIKGAPLTDAQAKAIDDRIRKTMRQLAVNDPNWQTLSADQRVLTAAQQAMQDIADEAARKVQNAQLQALKTVEVADRIADRMGRRQGKSFEKALEFDFDLTHAYIEGVKRDAMRGLIDLFEAATSGDGTGIGRRALMTLFGAENPQMTRDLALEVFAQGKAGTGNKLAKAGADAWLQTIDPMRQRFNSAGGDVGKLDYGYLPQSHDVIRILRAGPDKWAAEVLPMLDRRRYVKEDGSRLTDAEVLDVLRSAWETISSDGANKRPVGAFQSTGARANAGSQSREIHFKNGEAYLAYLERFGVGSMYDAMTGHIGAMAKNIGLVERYGPNPEAQMRVQFDTMSRTDGDPKTARGAIAQNMAGAEAQWNVLSGASGTPKHANLAAVGATVRNIETFGKLQGAVISSITDLGTYFVTAGYNKMDYWQALSSIGKATDSQTIEFMNMHGLMAESMISDLNRWAGENVRNNWSGRLSNATMRLSLMNAWTDTLRRGFQIAHMRATAKLADTAWAKLTEYDRELLQNKGLAEADWDTLRKAPKASFKGMDFITPEGIYAAGGDAQLVSKYLGMLSSESEIAVLNPDLKTRAIVTAGGSQAGTVGGEFARAVGQFKSFPIAMISRHWGRMLDTPQGLQGAPVMANKAAYSVALMVTLTGLGAIAFQTKQVITGKDPVDMTTPKFWARAFTQGGGAGFVGDLLLSDTSEDRSPLDTFGRTIMGPSYGSAADLWELTKGNIDEAAAGKKTHAGAEGIRFARSHLPLINLWYAKAGIDHLAMFAVQEAVSPGYLSRIENKAKKDWGQRYWWAPDEKTPGRAPDLGAVAP